MPDGGTLRLETANIVLEQNSENLPGVEPGLYVMLSVRDTGIGMSEEVQKRAFEPSCTTKEAAKVPVSALQAATAWCDKRAPTYSCPVKLGWARRFVSTCRELPPRKTPARQSPNLWSLRRRLEEQLS